MRLFVPRAPTAQLVGPRVSVVLLVRIRSTQAKPALRLVKPVLQVRIAPTQLPTPSPVQPVHTVQVVGLPVSIVPQVNTRTIQVNLLAKPVRQVTIVHVPRQPSALWVRTAQGMQHPVPTVLRVSIKIRQVNLLARPVLRVTTALAPQQPPVREVPLVRAVLRLVHNVHKESIRT